MFAQNLTSLGVLMLCNINKANWKVSNASSKRGGEEGRDVFMAFTFLILFSCHHSFAPERYS